MIRKNGESDDGEGKPARAKKWLGQHFLTSEAAIAAVVDAAELTGNDTVLEVGPGRGALTGKLLERAGKVVAVEKDRALVAHLREQFAQQVAENRLVLVEGDILDILKAGNLKLEAPYKVVANIPYYITGRFLRALLADGQQPSRAVLIVQKEVAERIVARKKPLDSARGKESILSLSVKVFGEPKYVKTIKAGSFSPAPDVDSAVLIIRDISRKNLDEKEETLFFSLVKAGFSQKRKQIAGNLRAIASDDALLPALSAAGIDPKARAEDVSLAQWIALAKILAQSL